MNTTLGARLLMLLVVAGCAVRPPAVSLVEESPRRPIIPPTETWPGIDRVGLVGWGFSGTAFSIGGGRWITAAHVVGQERIVDLGGRVALVVRADSIADVALLLSLAPPNEPTFAFSPTAIGEPATATGYVGHLGYGWQIAVRGHITSINMDSHILFNGGAQPGLSGSPVLNEHGEVVGMISWAMMFMGAPNGTMAVLVPASTIQEFITSPDGPAMPSQPVEQPVHNP